jgi:hypothetical protein
VWRYVEDVDPDTGEISWDKPPLSAGGRPGSSTNCKTWSTFARALAAYQTGGLDGIGLALDPQADERGLVIVAIDLDHCRDQLTPALARPGLWQGHRSINPTDARWGQGYGRRTVRDVGCRQGPSRFHRGSQSSG